MRWAIRTMQVPTRGASAFMPVPAQTGPASSNGQNIVTNTLGRVSIYSPRPAALRDDTWGGLVQPSSVAPNVMRWAIGIVHMNSTMHFPGKIFGHRPTPMPAGAIGVVPLTNPRKARIGGRTVTTTPRPFTQWPTYGPNKSTRAN